MPHPTLATLGGQVKKYRGNKTLRVAAKEIDISAATLMRVEAGRVPDVETFGKICKWMNVDPGAYLGFSQAEAPQSQENGLISMSAHFKVDAAPKPETVLALAKMILVAVGRQKSTLTNGDT
jgi:transcriptional regulator with XRE-family HTH domain